MLLHAYAQTYESVQQKPVVIINATIHVGNGTVFENGIIGFENGKISFVGDAQTVRYEAAKFEVINAAGKQVYPGIIAPNSTLGLTEIEAVRATNDRYETGDFNPNVRSIIAYNTDSRVIPTLRTNGILYAQVVPQGGIISGTSSVVETDGWNWEDAAYAMDNGLHLNWPSYNTYSWENGVRIIEDPQYANTVSAIETYFKEALAYSKSAEHAETNLRFEAMRGVFSGDKKLYIHVNGAKEIMHAVHFSDMISVVPVIIGGQEANLVTDLLRDKNIPVILQKVHELPNRYDYDIDLPYKLPSLLHNAGILCGLTISGGFWDLRNLPFEAGTAAAYGLTQEEALQCITLNNAKILGIDATCGSLEKGKDATLVISEGDILDMKTSKITEAYIRGRTVETKNWQEDLYNKYSKKYNQK